MATVILFLLFVLLFLVLVMYLTRGTAIKGIQVVGDSVAIPEVTSSLFHVTLKLLTATPLYKGNKIDLLLNGEETYPRLWEDLKAAREVISMHVFVYRRGKLADRMQEILIERARNGVRVFLLLDAFGSWGLGEDYIERLKDSGIEVAVFRPMHFKMLYKVQQRMHVRSIIVDGRVGYTGGFGIDDHWLGDGRHHGQWRETNVRMQGPVVTQLQVAFSANWAEATGDLLMGEALFPLQDFDLNGTQEAGIMYCAPSFGTTTAERFFVLSIAAARRKLYITNAYFVPDRDFRRLLIQAAERGVDVRVLTPGKNTDRPSAWYAGSAHYEDLLKAGVRIYEYQPTMVHAKTFIADGVWATVGTFNFDNRSMKLNDEVALIVYNETFGKQLESIFVEDLEYAKEITLKEVQERTWRERIKERVSLLVAPIL